MKSDIISIFKNKKPQPPAWNLKVKVVPGVLKDDGTWTPNADVSFVDWKFSILYNQDVICYHVFCNSDTWEAETSLPDAEGMHNVTMRLRERPPGVPGQMLRVIFLVENIDITYYIEKHAQFHCDSGETKVGLTYFGECGSQEFEIRTPIYQWLLDNDEDMLALLKQQTLRR